MKHLILLALLIASCTPVPTPTPVAVPVVKDYWKKTEHRDAAVKALQTYAKDLLAFKPKDAAEWCMEGDPLVYYTRLLSAMAVYENDKADPNYTYREKFKNGRGEFVISTGLTQVSYESCRGYGVTGATTESLKGINQNLECAARIYNRQIRKWGVIAQGNSQGAAAYFSTMRTSGKGPSTKKLICALYKK